MARAEVRPTSLREDPHVNPRETSASLPGQGFWALSCPRDDATQIALQIHTPGR